MSTSASTGTGAAGPARCRDAGGRPWLGTLLGLACWLAAAIACAERAQENAVTAAEDAFGLMVGNQTIGLYSMADARGFSPQQAGNLRIEGLYFDNASQYVGPCTARATVMRIGITAQQYSFPSPTGIADLKLHVPGDDAGVSAMASRGPYAEAAALVDGHAPLAQRLGGSFCVAYNKNFAPDTGRRADNIGAGVTLRWRPSEHTEIVPFWSIMGGDQHEVRPLVYTDGLLPPPLFDARQLAAQSFTSYGWRIAALGVVARQTIGPEWDLTAGLFRAREQDRQSYVEEYLSVLPDRSVNHVLDVLPPLTSTSSSGELRVARHYGGGVHGRKLDLSVRGRSADHAYGGDSLLDYGAATLDSPPPLVPISFATSAASIDETRQLDLGAVYEERWQGVGTLGLGLLKSHYRRTIRAPGVAAESSLATPWLANLRFTAEAGRALTLYGSFLQGLEDAALAPYSAVNRGQPPPATRTHQIDGGIRYAPGERLSLVLGAFEIHKVYFNLDAANLYTALGNVRHQGLESSFAYGADGLTILAGGVWLRPHVERTVPEPGATGTVPIGPVPLTLLANLDYAPARWRPFAASLQLNRLSARAATTDDRSFLPPLTTVSAGVRYEARYGNYAFSLRLDAANLTDAHGLHLTPLGQVVPEFGRRFMLSIAIDH